MKICALAFAAMLLAHPTASALASPITAPPPALRMVFLPVPANLTNTTDPHVCGSHAGMLGGLACSAAFSNGWLVLVFDWPGTKQTPYADAFNVYEVDNGKHALVDHNTLQGATVGVVQTPAGGFSNQCYAVTALVNGGESAPSNAYCLGNGTVGTSTTVLHSIASESRYRFHYVGLPTPPLPCTKAASPLICIGHRYAETTAGPVVVYHFNEFDRAYYKFDLSSLAGHYVVKATLKLTIARGTGACYSELGPADTDWTNLTNGTGIIDGNFQSPNGTLAGGLDVTTIVRAWVVGQANNGFVLRGSAEDTGADATSECWTDLNPSGELDVLHS
jgi:hypothetical protein